MSRSTSTPVSCGHDAAPSGDSVCSHLRDRAEPWLTYVKWYTGDGLEVELLCQPCAELRRGGSSAEASPVCEACYRRCSEEVGELGSIGGQPGIRVRPEPFETTLVETALPPEIGPVADLAPAGSTWLLLDGEGRLIRFDAARPEAVRLGATSVPAEPEREPWCNHPLRRRLHASPRGDFAAVVNDFGRFGEIIDLRTGAVALALDGGDDCAETVPFSFAFAELGGRVLALHRTDWNRVDLSDPATGELLSARGPTSYGHEDKKRPEHYLDYFHGALALSPGSTRVLDDGWVWHPVGVPSVWSLERWLENPWESEDGSSWKALCDRAYYWNGALVWLDEGRVAVGGIGRDEIEIVAGARIFEVTGEKPRELLSFAGPGGAFFGDGRWLYSSDEAGLSRWDPATGERTGHLPGFRPTRHHRGARELVELVEGKLVRLML
jgi:hypothetical protein